MIIVSVQLKSAISASRDTELARVHIANVGGDQNYGDYECRALRGRDEATLDLGKITRSGKVVRHARQREHVLNLVAKALASMGYGK